jgi:hypothetical protein
MTMLVHLIDERNVRRAERSGLLGQPRRLSSPDGVVTLDEAVHAMPVLPNYLASHQWLRELKQAGMRTIAAVHFRMRSDARVWVGEYNGEHRLVPLGHAAGLVMHEPDPRGWEIVIPASVPARSIHAIRAVPQVIGWRYFPGSHEQGPWKCLCDFCLQGQKGQIKSRRLRESLLAQHGADALNYEPRRRTRQRRSI